ncbi:MAG TPA: hypothetical protein VF893_04850 [Candidatus Bathyarchaeia archaeon]
MKIVKGWKRIDNERGFVNETTGQNLVVTKKPYGEHYLVLLFSKLKNDEEEGRKISPVYQTESKAEAFAMDWMSKHIDGENQISPEKSETKTSFTDFAKC